MLKDLTVKPGFFIAGAMKSGTTTLHYHLDAHDEIFIPKSETLFFSIDDFEQFPQAQWNGEWITRDFEEDFATYDRWHSEIYAEATEGQLLGADAPHYYCSKVAIDRIVKYCPDSKLIIILRDPVDRLESQYWHWVHSGQAVFSLEDTIRFQHGNLLRRSCYEEHIRYCLSKIPEHQIKILIFEEFVKEKDKTIAEVCDFLSLGRNTSLSTLTQRFNAGRYPKYQQLKLIGNYLGRKKFGTRYSKTLPLSSNPPVSSGRPSAAGKFLKWINPYQPGKQVEMADTTVRFLSQYLKRANQGLPELLNVDLAEHWKTFNQ